MGGRFLHLVQCSCGKRDWTRMSTWEWKSAHKRYCGQFEEEAYRGAEDRLDSERGSFEDALASGRYDPDTAA